ncbi:MAG TPA: DUF3662 and FHA domain-containing protein [Acidimicrobiia bacterium]|jgi:hypothetical protein
MGIARHLERRLERLVDGMSASLFRGTMHPVDLANRLVRHADLSATETVVGPAIPNIYRVAVNPADVPNSSAVEDLERELTVTLESTAADRGWRLDGPVGITLTTDEGVRAGSIACQTENRPGPVHPWAQLIDPRIGALLPVAPNRALVGRAEECDVVVDDSAVSRHHAVLFREGGKAWLADLGSSNGSTLNGLAVPDAAVMLHAGDAVTFGPATFSFRVL